MDQKSDLTTNVIQSYNSTQNFTQPVHPKLIGKGSFGCIYKPQVNCSFKVDSNSKQIIRDTYIKYISKIQVLTNDQPINYDDRSEVKGDQMINKLYTTYLKKNEISKETVFGKIIQTIPNYYMYFSPILGSCPIDINVLSLEEITKCNIFDKQKQSSNYINSKIQYIEGTSMSVYFKQILKTNEMGSTISTRGGERSPIIHSSDVLNTQNELQILPFVFVKKFIQAYRHLIKSINLLQKGADSNSIIIHYDLKDNNIIFDIKRGIPIIIDFGLSFNKKNLFEFEHPKMLKEIFYIYYDAYPPWCIDIVLLSYISQKVLLKKTDVQTSGGDDDLIKEIYENGSVDIKELQNIVDNFIDKNDILKWVDELDTKIIEKGIKTKIKNQWYFYIESFQGKNWKDFIIDLRERYILWDTYSISICFLTYIHDLNILNGKYKTPIFLNQMIQQLVKVFEKI
jgi:serine/threonine protein kinase